MELLAHSGRPGILPQSYATHITNVRERAEANMRAALDYARREPAALGSFITWASTYHDLGKLDEQNQIVLRSNQRGALPINHVDAGAAYLCSVQEIEAALAVYSHHIGLCDLVEERVKALRNAQDNSQYPFRDLRIKTHTDTHLHSLIQKHREIVVDTPEATQATCKLNGFERRLLLSCLVDADHADTARHYGQKIDPTSALPRWRERLAALDRFVGGLGDNPGSRNQLRREIYGLCQAASSAQLFWACDSPVGSGKTTAVMAYLLKAAIHLNLRHIFVVLPYTNIVEQAVDVYRRSLVLPGEDAAQVVAAHHHQAEFASPDLRYLTTLWDCPIIVTTAVQFFETLGSNQTARLRKLHELPGSAVFIDEAHAAVPIHLWPFMWQQLVELASSWSCRFVLGSGSLARFWENPRILGKGNTWNIPTMAAVALSGANQVEKERVRYKSHSTAMRLPELTDWILEHPGPRLVVMNTVQSAAVVAHRLREQGGSALHLSTALAPVHRKAILALVRQRLREESCRDFTLVATSCVEAGVDLSFAVAFRERCRASSLIQIGGRVNRHAERSSAEVWDFVVNDPQLPQHPDFRYGREVVEHLFNRNMWDGNPSDLITYALEQEFIRFGQERRIEQILQAEKLESYPEVAKLTRVITSDTRLVLVDKSLIDVLRSGGMVDRSTVLAHSVQLWATRIEALALSPIGYGMELFAWEYPYDKDFLGIMQGVMQQKAISAVGYAII